jgi:hypothetical protein
MGPEAATSPTGRRLEEISSKQTSASLKRKPSEGRSMTVY